MVRGPRGRRFAKKMLRLRRRALVRAAGSSWRWTDWFYFAALVGHDVNVAAQRGVKIPRSLRMVHS
jgi:hypothetical protein